MVRCGLIGCPVSTPIIWLGMWPDRGCPVSTPNNNNNNMARCGLIWCPVSTPNNITWLGVA